LTAPLLTFLLPVTLLTLTPGVDTLLIIRNTSRGGWWDGAISSLGICGGLFIHALVSAIGISLILLQSALAFTLLKLIGAGYLIWLGGNSLRSAVSPSQLTIPAAKEKGSGGFLPRRSLLEGFLSNVLNPKAIVFYMAFLPQFIDPTGSALQQSLLLASLHFIIAMTYQCLLAAVVDRARHWLRDSRVRRSIDAVTGSLMVLLGLKLALDS